MVEMLRATDCDTIVLAAGLSSRMPGGKLLRITEGRPLIRIAVGHALEASRRAIVVVGHEADAVIAALGEAPSHRLVVVRNPHYRDGMLGSIQAGMRSVTSAWFFIVPGDMPLLVRGVYNHIAAAAPHIDDAASVDGDDHVAPPRAVVPYYRNTRGHPVLIHRSLIPALLSQPRDAGPMRDLLSRCPVRRVDLDEPAITVDLDTEDAFRRYRDQRAGPPPR